jgi:hypothetical protein
MQTEEAVIAMTAIVLGSLMFLIPIAGITARIALRPIMDALGRYKEVQGDKQMQQLLERRVSLMEEQLHSMDRSLRDLVEASEFHRELDSGRHRTAALPLPTAEVQVPPHAVSEAQPEPISRTA